MAENAMSGIMSLPGEDERGQGGMQVDPEFFTPEVSSYARNNPVEFGENIIKGMEEADPEMVREFRDELAGLSLPEEAIDALGQMIDLILEDPEDYPEIREGLLQEGVPEDLLPEEFDLAFFTAMNIALDQLSIALPGSLDVGEDEEEEFEPFPINRAEGGIAELKPMAAAMANMGRNGDSMLAHITPSEARLLRQRGGSGTINPYTGLPEFFLGKIIKGIGKAVKGVVKFVGSAVKGVVNVVKKVAKSPIGKIALTAAGIWALGPAGLNLAGGVGSMLGVSMTPALAMGINTFAANTVVNLAGGQDLGDAVKNGAIAGVLAGGASKLTGWAPESYQSAYGTPDVAGAVDAAAGISPEGAMTEGGGLADSGGMSAEALYRPSSVDMSAAGGSGSAASSLASSSKEAGGNLLSKAWNWVKENPPRAALYGGGALLLANALSDGSLTEGEPAEVPPGLEGLAQGDGKTGVQLLSESPGLYKVDMQRTGAFKGTPVEGERRRDPYSGYADGGYVQEYNIGGPAFPETPLSYSPNAMSTYGGMDLQAPFAFAEGGNVPDPRDPSNFPRRTGQIQGPGTPTSDSIPAMLSDGEFVFTKRAVDGAAKLANGGSPVPPDKARKDGARQMYELMKTLEDLAR